jgi:hypothetical protein
MEMISEKTNPEPLTLAYFHYRLLCASSHADIDLDSMCEEQAGSFLVHQIRSPSLYPDILTVYAAVLLVFAIRSSLGLPSEHVVEQSAELVNEILGLEMEKTP